MTARYFTANVHQGQVIVLSGPHPTHDAAMKPHVDRLAAGGTLSGHWTPTVLLDPASLGDTDLVEILQTDVALRAIYELGYQQGAIRTAPPEADPEIREAMRAALVLAADEILQDAKHPELRLLASRSVGNPRAETPENMDEPGQTRTEPHP